MNSVFRLFFLILFSFSISSIFCGCSKFGKRSSYDIVPEDELYQSAMQNLDKGRYESALSKIEDLELEYPSSTVLPNALYLKAKSLHHIGKYEESNLAIDSFLLQFPYHENAQELAFTKCLNYYARVMDVRRDQSMTLMALGSFRNFLEDYPNSVYRPEAKLKIEYLEAALAGKEMDVGYFYYHKKNYSAALRRFQNVIEDYPTTIFVPEALYRTAEIFLILRLPEEAQIYAAILGKNYPDSKWYNQIYQSFEDLQEIE